MGMDVFGRNPLCEEGTCFRASIFEWPTIYETIVRFGQDLADPEVLEAMRRKEGAGLSDPRVCHELAKRTEDWLEGSEFKNRRLISSLLLDLASFDGPGGEMSSCGATQTDSRDLIQEWIGFLRHCGGFYVC